MSGGGRLRVGGLVAVASILFGLVGSARPFTLLYTNDLHLRFSRLESLERLIEAARAEGGALLLVDGGDAIQDFRTPLAAVWGADEMIEWMNGVGYDAMALGNHEIYWGPQKTWPVLDHARFPILCSNLVPADGYDAPFEGWTSLSVDGLRILLVGVVTNFHLPYPDYPWLRYVAPEEAIAGVLNEASGPFDLVVAVGHVPVARACEIARSVSGIDVFVTGHSHEETPEPVRAGETLVVQSGSFGRKLGRLRIEIEGGDVTLLSNELLAAEEAPTEIGRGLAQLLMVSVAFLATALLVLL